MPAKPDLSMDPSDPSYRYFRNAVERHWDPYDIPLEQDREAFRETYEELREFADDFKRNIALFGAGEESVTEDLAPLAVALDDIEDEMFVTTQMYEEAKHAEFFDRYWREVIHPLEEEFEDEFTTPTDPRWFNDAYTELFDREEEAMHRLLTDDSVENRALAFCHYHLTVEGILAQTGYYGFHTSFSGDNYPELPELPGLVEGFSLIRSDEGRHVGFGMGKLKQYVADGEIEVELINTTMNELLELIQGILADTMDPEAPGIDIAELVQYAGEKHADRMKQITDASAEMPDVDELTSLGD